MHTTKHVKAVSTLVLILLILCFTIFGALVSYLWVIGSFYFEPEGTVTLTITDASFPVKHADYFNFTIMNPAHSVSDANITEIYFVPKNETIVQNVNDTYPMLPIKLARGTSQNIKCFTHWGQYAGQSITIGVVAAGASGATKTVATRFVKVGLNAYFDPAASSKQFRLSVENNANSAINLTLSKVTFGGMLVQNLSIPSDQNLTTGIPVTFYCNYNWEGFREENVRVETEEGYYAVAKANATAVLSLSIDAVKFSETDSNKVSITVTNSELNSTSVDVNDITLTYDNQTVHLNGSISTPKFSPFCPLNVNETVTFKDCQWNWTNYRNKPVTVSVYTVQNYTAASKGGWKTPDSVRVEVTPSFNLSDTNSFLVNVTSLQTSLFDINVTEIKLHLNQTSITSQVVKPGNWTQFKCIYNWASWRGLSRMVYVNASYGSPVSRLVFGQAMILPSVYWIISGQANASERAFNVTVESHSNSLNATLAELVVTYENQTVFQSQGIGFLIQPSQTATLTFPWDWTTAYATKTVKISVYTMQDAIFEGTLTFPQLPP